MLTDKYFNKGNSFFKLRKYQEAIKKFNLAIKCNPDSTSTLISLHLLLVALTTNSVSIACI
ncbi:TPR repeat family protein [Orientia tsutsugamushi str. Gilliam]|uniref:TPR repeat family protein n=1 Tax=Orientia tsutsugamushi str. Gilliam TaxID=1359184 RepID=A0A0F3MEB1_ORITS|nr:tetratricopeptide repeat protein [Orientia tsutsugamushi]KJV54065.1 TPR repeat family protein [Orientia tsutsugamushi str. Gilliam]SPR06972.1 TPR repeat-containing protein 08 [Orientia tsutsugamushi str. Gilliam]